MSESCVLAVPKKVNPWGFEGNLPWFFFLKDFLYVTWLYYTIVTGLKFIQCSIRIIVIQICSESFNS